MSQPILITGAGSRTAAALVPMLLEEADLRLVLLSSGDIGYQHERITHHTLDVLDKQALKRVVMETMPGTIINLAALTAVDKCESDRNLCWNVNVGLVEQLTRLCRITDARFLQLSTDYVFDGAKGPYTETDTPQPINYYGKSKLAAENVALSAGVQACVVRTNVIYGPDPDHPDFVRWLIDGFDANAPLKVATDQYGNPTYVDDLAETIVRLIRKQRSGIYHTGGADWTSRYDFAVRAARLFKADESLIVPVTSDELQQQAKRPLRSGLVTLKTESDTGMKFRGIESGLVSLRHALFARLQAATSRKV